ncbi:hypothetical protein GOODEAATRI_031007 [Goodea atripinnis]|uniref:FBA domain-containing protein n=1 Tax=Goodea atripinnis TaxID=208336 RepID=A0ABV0NZ38_9TELE
MSAAAWKQRCEAEWGLQGAPMPDTVDWKSVYEAKPLGRNLVKNPAPLDVTGREHWFTLEQVVDLKAEGLWDELLDTFQPKIVIQDW